MTLQLPNLRRLLHRLCGNQAGKKLAATLLFLACVAILLLQSGLLPGLSWDSIRHGRYSALPELDGDRAEHVWKGRMPWLAGDVATWKDDRLACITLTFDDGSWSAVAGVPDLLSRYDVPATFYVITSELHVKPAPYQDHLHKLLRHGHEVGSHTHNHRSLWDNRQHRPIGDIRDQVEHSIAALKEMFGQHLGNGISFSYPFGGGFMDPGVRSYLQRAGIVAARTIQQGMNSALAGRDEMMRVKAFPLTSYTHANSLRWYVERVVKNGRSGLDLTWLVFFGHGARIAPYEDDVGAGYEPMSVADLTGLLQTISERVRDRTVWAATMRDAAAYIHNRKRTAVTIAPVTAERRRLVAPLFCKLMHGEAGSKRRPETTLVAMTTPEDCVRQAQRRTVRGNLVIVAMAIRGLAMVTAQPVVYLNNGPTRGTGDGRQTDEQQQAQRTAIPYTPMLPGAVTVCANVYLDVLEDDSSQRHDTFLEDILSRRWMCEAIVNDVKFASTCRCRLKRDDSGARHHDDDTKHVYKHNHRHGNLENAKVRCCFNHRTPDPDVVVTAKLLISSQANHMR